MQISTLIGAELDAAVIEAEGRLLVKSATDTELHLDFGQENPGFRYMRASAYSPSTDWEQGGPIIEREQIGIAWFGEEVGWGAEYVEGDGYFASVDFRHFGPTPLIAAMRAFVDSKSA